MLLLIAGCSIWTACERFLDAKPYSTLAQPHTLKDLRAILDREESINNIYPMALQVASDDLETTYEALTSMPQIFQNTYLWNDQGLDGASWSNPYQAISIANVVLEALERIDGGDVRLRKQLEGEALFIRGWMLFNLAQIYCNSYSVTGQNNGLGLVLRMDSDSEITIGRSNLEDTYIRIFTDLHKALELLPEEGEFITRPSRLVVHAALARIYLVIDDFEHAERMVDEVLKVKNNLLDFSTLDFEARYPLEVGKNTEIIYHAASISTGHFVANASTHANPELYSLYDENDLRKRAYFESGNIGMKFRGYYHGRMADYFAGLATDEMYLIKAECAARRRDIETGSFYLNELRRHRYEKEYFEVLSFTTDMELLTEIIEERRRQLVCRGIRWLDLRRLNRDENFAQSIYRELDRDGEQIIYELKPNSLRYVFLIPTMAVEIGRYEQNPR
ncbi:RagB/SusD family nutrient uptake outer membrane protein [Sphingobacterium chuzhouense]|uniref:RagB/SusD family nutrient uptake outer membrane protein n=1 Tax=Sphingobacterium chuzhouense TaxID=1742264 RepID=A0ABR7XXH3_9SPHI|nr:RagB/SusD family nutrient uptake outer membrane protein [Sphingobacterium chuzhouense]MBD1423752.1 RagB/SusD family nutrient uptake outer membrane protein [Sphingobacterium chuzhouense]